MTIDVNPESNNPLIPINHDHPGDRDEWVYEEIILQPKQAEALDMMLAGKSDSEISARVGMTRQTVNHWRNHDENFKRVLSTRRLEVWQAVKDEMSGMYTEALGVLRKNLKSKDPKLQMKAATQIINLHELKDSLVNENHAYLKMLESFRKMDQLLYWLQRNKKKKDPEEMTLDDMVFELEGKEHEIRRRYKSMPR